MNVQYSSIIHEMNRVFFKGGLTMFGWMDSKWIQSGEILCMTIYTVNANASAGNPIGCVRPCGSMSSSGTWTFQTLDFISPFDPRLSASPPDGDELTRRAVGAAGHVRRRQPCAADTSTVTDRANKRVVSRHETRPSPVPFFFFNHNPAAKTFFSPPAPAELTTCPLMCMYHHVKVYRLPATPTSPSVCLVWRYFDMSFIDTHTDSSGHVGSPRE